MDPPTGLPHPAIEWATATKACVLPSLAADMPQLRVDHQQLSMAVSKDAIPFVPKDYASHLLTARLKKIVRNRDRINIRKIGEMRHEQKK